MIAEIQQRHTIPRENFIFAASHTHCAPEIRQDKATDVTEGQTLTVEVFNDIGRVDVIGTSKGRGFSGVLKRHGVMLELTPERFQEEVADLRKLLVP